MNCELPRVIHYCWFGGKPLPASAQKCLASWRHHMPDYEIRRWDESNFDVNAIPYTAEAYRMGKYAFVSDYARFKVLNEYGGLYFDTDVEVLRPLDDICTRGPWMGVECYTPELTMVAPGLGLGATPGMPVLADIIDYYHTHHFADPQGRRLDTLTVVPITSRILLGPEPVRPENEIFEAQGFTIYPPEYFNPYESLTGRCHITQRTYTVHWYDASWSGQSRLRLRLGRLWRRLTR